MRRRPIEKDNLQRKVIAFAQASILFLAYVGIINDLDLKTNVTTKDAKNKVQRPKITL